MRDFAKDLRLIIESMEEAARVAPTCTEPHPSANQWASYRTAQEEYSRYVEIESHRVAKLLGFSWVATEDAPSDYEAVVREFHECRATGRPFRVWNGASEGTVFLSVEHNYMVRFIHDLEHVTEAALFTHDNEVYIIEKLVWRVYRRRGFLAALLCACDQLAQAYYNQHNHGAYVEEQEPYVRSVFFYLLRQYHMGLLDGGK